MVIAVAVGLLLVAGADRKVFVAAVAGIGVAASAPPALAAVAPLVAVATMQRRLGRRRRRKAAQTDGVVELSDLTALGLTGGLGFGAALGLAARQVGGELEIEVRHVVRMIRIDGAASSLTAADGAARRLYRIAARAAASGAAMLEPMRRLSDQLLAEQHASRLERARRLPVLMLFPLTLLILPGFVLLVIAPAVADAFGRLQL
jgi:tight adherence protein C